MKTYTAVLDTFEYFGFNHHISNLVCVTLSENYIRLSLKTVNCYQRNAQLTVTVIICNLDLTTHSKLAVLLCRHVVVW